VANRQNAPRGMTGGTLLRRLSSDLIWVGFASPVRQSDRERGNPTHLVFEQDEQPTLPSLQFPVTVIESGHRIAVRTDSESVHRIYSGHIVSCKNWGTYPQCSPVSAIRKSRDDRNLSYADTARCSFASLYSNSVNKQIDIRKTL